MLVEKKKHFSLVYPDISLKSEYLKRAEDRGSDKNFIDVLDKNWDVWIKSCSEQKKCNKIVLSEGEYLTDDFESHLNKYLSK